MKSLLVVCVLLLVVPVLLAQDSKAPAKDSSMSDEQQTAPPPLLQNPPHFPMRIDSKAAGAKAAATSGLPVQGFHGGIYGSDYLTVSNYGQPGVLILGLGDEFNGVMANYLACHIWAIYGQQGRVIWNDGTPDTPMFFVPPLWSRQAGTIKTPQKSGTYNVTVIITNQCADWWRHATISNTVSNTATAYVYESIPISTFQINCPTATPCASIKGGQLASGVVTNTVVSPSTGIGTLVLISASGPGSTVPYIIETVGLQTVSFDIQTTPVTTNTPLTVSVYSGGTTQTQTITVTP